MLNRYSQVPLSYLFPRFSEWETAYKDGNIVNVFFVPYGDLLFRSMQYVDWMKNERRQEVIIINFETDLVVNPENLEDILAKNRGRKLLFIAKRVFMRPDGEAMASILHKWYALNSDGLIILHEGFPSEMDMYVHNQVMSHKRIMHALYPDSVAKEYCVGMAELFGKKISDNVMNKAIDYSAGFPWLINDILRRSDEDNLLENTNLIWKVEQIAKSIPRIKGIEKDLIEFGLKTDKGYWVPFLQSYLNSVAKDKLILNDNEIIFEGRDFSHLFSEGEKRILCALKNSGGVVEREEIGKQFWQDKASEEYSEWALDTIMCRLRKKLAKYDFPLKINTRRGIGYELS